MHVLYIVVGLSKANGYSSSTATTVSQAVSQYTSVKASRLEWHYLYIFRIDFTDPDKPIIIRLETE